MVLEKLKPAKIERKVSFIFELEKVNLYRDMEYSRREVNLDIYALVHYSDLVVSADPEPSVLLWNWTYGGRPLTGEFPVVPCGRALCQWPP